METIQSIVRNLVFLVLFVAYLEMLLPLRDFRKFMQVILGLFVMVTILNPLVSLFRQDFLPLDFELYGRTEKQNGELRTILAQGRELQETTTEQARGTYIKHLEKQVEVLTRLIPGVATADAQVVLDDSASSQSFGAIDKVYLKIDLDEKKQVQSLIAPIEDIQIRTGGQRQEEKREQKEVPSFLPGMRETFLQVQETVASLFGLRPEQVVVTTLESVR